MHKVLCFKSNGDWVYSFQEKPNGEWLVIHVYGGGMSIEIHPQDHPPRGEELIGLAKRSAKLEIFDLAQKMLSADQVFRSIAADLPGKRKLPAA